MVSQRRVEGKKESIEVQIYGQILGRPDFVPFAPCSGHTSSYPFISRRYIDSPVKGRACDVRVMRMKKFQFISFFPLWDVEPANPSEKRRRSRVCIASVRVVSASIPPTLSVSQPPTGRREDNTGGGVLVGVVQGNNFSPLTSSPRPVPSTSRGSPPSAAAVLGNIQNV